MSRPHGLASEIQISVPRSFQDCATKCTRPEASSRGNSVTLCVHAIFLFKPRRASPRIHGIIRLTWL
jgi:hypothetical protein